MHSSTQYLFGALLTLALLAPACGSDDPVTPTDPTPPSETSEIFDGTVTVNGAVTHPFIVQRAGTVVARLAIVDPDAAAVIGMSLGTWNGAACQIILANDNAVLGVTLTGTASVAGSFCVRAYDVGKLTSPTSYQIVVTHF